MNPTSSAALSLPSAFAAACKMAGPFEVHVVNRHSGVRHSQTFDHPFVLLGRAKPMRVRLDDPSVSQCHAFLQIIEGVPYCTDLGSRTGVVWDDGSQGRGWVFPGQTLRIGIFDVTLSGPGASQSTPPLTEEPLDVDPALDDLLASVGVEVHIPGSSSAYHPFERVITLIGRHPTCHLRFLDDAVSYFHCAIVNTADGAWVLDFLSRKGTLLNGRTTRLARLRDGDLIELGKVSLVVRSAAGTGAALVLNGNGKAHGPLPAEDPGLALPQKMAESVMGAFAPMREVMGQFQECFVTMARMFTAMQQEQSSLMCEQMRLLQDLTRELRELRADVKRDGVHTNGTALPANGDAAAPATHGTATEHGRRLPSPKPCAPPEAAALADAHDWFLERLAKLSQPATPNGT